jgi:hypothetical protein
MEGSCAARVCRHRGAAAAALACRSNPQTPTRTGPRAINQRPVSNRHRGHGSGPALLGRALVGRTLPLSRVTSRKRERPRRQRSPCKGCHPRRMWPKGTTLGTVALVHWTRLHKHKHLHLQRQPVRGAGGSSRELRTCLISQASLICGESVRPSPAADTATTTAAPATAAINTITRTAASRIRPNRSSQHRPPVRPRRRFRRCSMRPRSCHSTRSRSAHSHSSARAHGKGSVSSPRRGRF